jgi:uncharacterized protein YecE (DUF72 family)
VIHIGTAGWGIASRYKDAFTGTGSQLEQYGKLLNAVEINSSFRRQHKTQTYARWASSVPDHFRFSVKVPSSLTHDGGLSADAQTLERFATVTRGLGGKLGVILVQLPPTLTFETRTAKRFFAVLRKHFDVQVACEPRHPSWGSDRAERVLRDLAIARVAADPPLWPGAGDPGGFRKVAYFRWHGQPRTYYSDYDEQCLLDLRGRLALAGAHTGHVWLIFDNTVLGHALGNAMAMTGATSGTKSLSFNPDGNGREPRVSDGR